MNLMQVETLLTGVSGQLATLRKKIDEVEREQGHLRDSINQILTNQQEIIALLKELKTQGGQNNTL